mmetsp:Transcript_25108/g.51058  ORF Transcript_25108/g.51058 Transcript_25108/m.51058 type:complete len:462 (-) Transcript_25108:111-1496(-)
MTEAPPIFDCESPEQQRRITIKVFHYIDHGGSHKRVGQCPPALLGRRSLDVPLEAVKAPLDDLGVIASVIVRPHLHDVVVGAREEGHTLVHLLRLQIHDAGLAGEGESATLLHEERHGGSLVQETQLAVLVLGVRGVSEDAAVQECAVHVTNHRADVASRVLDAGLALGGLEGGHVLLEGLVPVPAVRLVEGVDLAALGHLHVGVGEHELPDRAVVGETVEASAKGEHEHAGGGVEAVASSSKGSARLEGVEEALALHGTLLHHAVLHALSLLVHAKDSASGDVGVNVGRSVKRVEHRHVLGPDVSEHVLVLALTARHLVGVLVENRGVLLLRGDDTDLAGELESALEHVVGDNVKLLLLFALDVHAPSAILVSNHAGDGGTIDKVGNCLARERDAADQRLEITEIRVGASHLHHVSSEGDASLLAHLVEDRSTNGALLRFWGGTLLHAERGSAGSAAINR